MIQTHYFLSPVFRYDPRVNKWMMVKPMSTRRKHLGTAVYNGCLYAVGGRDESCELSSAEKYDPVTNEWNTVVAMNNRRSGVIFEVTAYFFGKLNENFFFSTSFSQVRYRITDFFTSVYFLVL